MRWGHLDKQGVVWTKSADEMGGNLLEMIRAVIKDVRWSHERCDKASFIITVGALRLSLFITIYIAKPPSSSQPCSSTTITTL